ncbi:pyridoxamine 5'-phosphate oxidase family protein [Xanthobacter dioxanivorans]|uniref:Pyridoxamine 5'-phosphate oxidase family protein n=1 Tax=Xanthobacter dioxanivorans TaxID=2528964 RepID=A0A974PPS7_9HYPH|nr:pyridoxamine 5'-phosphate oxidase family protein [Xanthobacter dioxanivorans]QRG07517.1 pyridoxamine 5'-phosphate oxidase family protein [Xanthobacter dioxanivorans]
MARIADPDALRRLYGQPSGRSVDKELGWLDPHCRHFISLSPFVLIATADAAGATDVSPRGDTPGFVAATRAELLIPDRPGNNRLDSLTNILATGRVGLLFLIPGVDETLRVNGRAAIHDDADLLARFAVGGKAPRTVLRVEVEAAYLHCAKAFMRSRLWDARAQVERSALPTMGEMLRDQIASKPDAGATIEAESQEAMVERYRALLY